MQASFTVHITVLPGLWCLVNTFQFVYGREVSYTHYRTTAELLLMNYFGIWFWNIKVMLCVRVSYGRMTTEMISTINTFVSDRS